jgi:hypothetical protein
MRCSMPSCAAERRSSSLIRGTSKQQRTWPTVTRELAAELAVAYREPGSKRSPHGGPVEFPRQPAGAGPMTPERVPRRVSLRSPPAARAAGSFGDGPCNCNVVRISVRGLLASGISAANRAYSCHPIATFSPRIGAQRMMYWRLARNAGRSDQYVQQSPHSTRPATVVCATHNVLRRVYT